MDEIMEQRIEELRRVKENALQGGGPAKVARQKERGKLLARERLEKILDPGSFNESLMLTGHIQGDAGDGIVSGYGTINGRMVCILSQDATIQGGSIGNLHGFKMTRTLERALEMRVPLISLGDSPGYRNPKMSQLLSGQGAGGMDVGEEMTMATAIGEKNMFFANVQASGVVPQISAILGSCGGVSVYSPALMDFVFMVDNISHMFITGPRIVKSVMAEDLTMDELGGTKIHSRLSGVCDRRFKTEDDCFESIKQLLSYLPSNCDESPPWVNTGDDPNRIDETIQDVMPIDANKPFDMHLIIKRIVDNGDFYEIKPEFAGEMIVGLGRLNGYVVGIIANQPIVRAGSLTVDSSTKEARFMRFCDCFNIPLVMLVDTPAYQPGSQQEQAGIIRHGAKVLYALCESTVPRISVILRKAYGGGNLGMGSIPGMGTDFIYSWPTAEMGVMGAEQSVDLFFGPQIAAAPDPVAYKQQMVDMYKGVMGNPVFMASFNPFTEDVIEPKDTRRILIRSLESLRAKKISRQPKRHGNIPL